MKFIIYKWQTWHLCAYMTLMLLWWARSLECVCAASTPNLSSQSATALMSGSGPYVQWGCVMCHPALCQPLSKFHMLLVHHWWVSTRHSCQPMKLWPWLSALQYHGADIHMAASAPASLTGSCKIKWQAMHAKHMPLAPCCLCNPGTTSS